MSFAKKLISDLISKNVRFEVLADYDIKEALKNKKLEYEHDLDDVDTITVFGKRDVPEDYLILNHPCKAVEITILDEIPCIEPIGLQEYDEISITLLPKGKARVILPYSVKRSVHDSLRSYLKDLGYKTVSFRRF